MSRISAEYFAITYFWNLFFMLLYFYFLWVGCYELLDFRFFVLKIKWSILIRNTFNNYEQFLMHVQSQPVFLDWYTKSWPSITPSRVESYKAFKGYLADSCLIHFDTAHKRNVYSHCHYLSMILINKTPRFFLTPTILTKHLDSIIFCHSFPSPQVKRKWTIITKNWVYYF